MTRYYLKPVLEPLVRTGGSAQRLAAGPLGFRMVEVFERGERSRHLVSAREAEQINPEVYQNLVTAREPFAGLDLAHPHLMGILNVTPDSFSDGGKWLEQKAAIERGRELDSAGASIIDIGGESTRPGSTGTGSKEQLKRILPVIEALGREGATLSVDTRDAVVMRAAIASGAGIVNDVSGLRYDPSAARTVAELDAPVVLMHMRGTPADMSDHALYDDVILDVYDELSEIAEAALSAGITRQNICLDPGIGFAKKPEHSIAVLQDLPLLHGLGFPLLVGASRKGFIKHYSGDGPDEGQRLAGSLMAMTWALNGGAGLLRVHDVAASRQALAIWRRLVRP
jgi:dihydropteroate synthase